MTDLTLSRWWCGRNNHICFCLGRPFGPRLFEHPNKCNGLKCFVLMHFQFMGRKTGGGWVAGNTFRQTVLHTYIKSGRTLCENESPFLPQHSCALWLPTCSFCNFIISKLNDSFYKQNKAQTCAIRARIQSKFNSSIKTNKNEKGPGSL